MSGIAGLLVKKGAERLEILNDKGEMIYVPLGAAVNWAVTVVPAQRKQGAVGASAATGAAAAQGLGSGSEAAGAPTLRRRRGSVAARQG